MDEKLSRWLVEWRHLLLGLTLVAIAVIAYGARNLYFDSDYRIFFKPDNPQLLAHEEMEAEYTRSDNVVFIVVPKDGEVFTRSTLASIEQLTAESWKVPYAVRVDSITNFQHTRASQDDLATFSLVENARTLSDQQLLEKREIAIHEPLLVNGLISDRGHVTAVNVRLTLPENRGGANQAIPEVAAYARELKILIEAANPNVEIKLHGLVFVNQTFNDLAQRDAETLVPIMFAVVIVLLVIFLRSVSAMLTTVFVIIFSLTVSVGFMGWVGYHLNQINVSAPTIILTLAISDSVHILLTYLQGLGQGLDRPAAMRDSLKVNLAPVFLTNFTTAIGFAGLNYSDSPPFTEVGNVAAFGVMGTMVMSFTLLPGIMLMLPVRIRAGMGEEAHWKIVDQVCEFALRHRRRLLWAILAAVAACAAFIPRNDLNDNTIDYFGKRTELRKTLDFTQENLTGLDDISYSLPSGAQDGIADPAYLKKVEAFAQWYASQPEVVHVSSFTEIIKRLNRNMHGDDPAWYRVPDERDLAAQYILLYEMSLPFGLDLNSMVNFDKSATKFSVSIRGQKAQQLIDLEARAQAWLQTNAPEMATPGSSVSLMFAHIGQNNIKSMVNGAFTSIFLITLTMVFALRSFRFAAISLIPNLLPSAMAFGLWGLFVGQVNLAVAAVFNISSGIVIDDTIHFMTKYLRARRKDGKSPEDAVRYSFATTGSALFVNTAVLALGFLVLTVSDFTVNSSMGVMTALVIVIALFFDLLFLPALLTGLDRQKAKPAA